MKRKNMKNLIALFFAAIMIFAVCLPVSAVVERQSVHINTPGISIEIPGDAVYNVKEADTGELMNASDEKNTYTLTLNAEKSSDDLFTYKDLSKSEIEQTQVDIQTELNADKVTTYETSQAVFFDCINNTDKCLVSTTVVNGYKYQLKLAVEKRELTISDHGIFNTAARSIVFDSVEKKPVEVNVLGTIGTIVCVAIAVLVLALIIVILIRYIRTKLPKKKTKKKEIKGSEQPKKLASEVRGAKASGKEEREVRTPKEVNNDADRAPRIDVVKPIRPEKIQMPRGRRRDTRADDAAESFYKEIELDGLFDEQAEEEIPTQVQMDIIDNVPGDENFENTPVRMRVDIIKPVKEKDEDAENSDLHELSRNNNEDYDEAATDYADYPEEKSIGDRVRGIFGKPQKDDNQSEGKAAKPKSKKASASAANQRSPRPQRTEEERARAAERRRQREANRPEHKGSYSDSEFVKSFDNDSYWDKYR